jgi:histidine triad (HIT) family protein
VAGCIFCSIIDGSAPSETVYADEHAVAFMDINPAGEGHTLVVPRAHSKDLWEIPDEDARNVMAAAVRVAAAIRTALKPDGVNIMHATGVAAFQSVFHFHLHVVPRWLGDPIRLPFVPRPGDRSAITSIAQRIRTAAGS